MANTPIELGAPGDRAAENIRRIRSSRGLELAQLSELLKDLGRPIGVPALSRIENKLRRIDVADLVAIAIALKTTPNWLLFGRDPYHPAQPLELTPVQQAQADDIWRWATGDYPMGANTGKEIYEFQKLNRPHMPPQNPLPLPRGIREHEVVLRLEQAYKDAAHLFARDPRALDAVVEELRAEQQEPFDLDAWLAEGNSGGEERG